MSSAARMAAIVVGAALSGRALADPILQVTSYSYELHPVTRVVSVELVFNRPPDFQHADPVGRQADAFWLDIDADMNAGTGLYADWYHPALGIDRRISGYEIWQTGTLIVRDQVSGPELGPLEYSLLGTTVRFEAAYELLGIPPGAGGLYFAINAAEYGATTHLIMVVPVPRAVGLGLSVLIATGMFRIGRARPGSPRSRHR
jgi:hypothetical protein